MFVIQNCRRCKNYIIFEISQEGASITTADVTGIFRGTIIVFLGAHQVGGFKVGVGFSLRKRRECMATRGDMQSKVLLVVLINLYAMCNFQFTEDDFLLSLSLECTCG